MTLNFETAKNIAPLVTPLISSIVEVWIKPKLQELYKSKSISKQLFESHFDNKFEEYLIRAFERNSKMNTVVFQNQPKNIWELYIPLTLQTLEGDRNKILIDEFREELFLNHKKIVITDSAGMGKSTVLKWMFIDAIKSNVGVPIFIELRKLSDKNQILDEIFKELNPIEEVFDRSFILNLIKRGDFIFFLDGYDEIPLDVRREVTEELQNFISKASKNIFILSSRPQTAVASFVDFYEYKIRPLEKDEAFKLLRKYDKQNNVAEQLIETINEQNNFNNLSEFLNNPLMVSLLFKGYEYKQTVSYKKSIFYRQVYDALYENHDLSKGGAFIHEKASGLDIEEYHTVLRAFAFFTWKIGKIEYDKDEIIKFISKAKANTKISFKESKFLEDLISSVPLFYKEGNYYKWKHKSIQEYFSAQYICTDTKSDQETILNNIYLSINFDDYINVLDLCYEIDYKTFRHTIIHKFCSEILEYQENYYNFDYEVDTLSLMERKRICLWRKCIIFCHSDYNFMDIYEDSLKIATKKFSNELKGFEPIVLYSGEKFQLFDFSKINYKILEFFSSKKEPFIERKDSGHTSIDKEKYYDDVLTRIIVSNGQIIDENPSSPFNNPAYFDIINDYLLATLDITYDIKIDMITKLKNEIEKEIVTAQSDEITAF
ncbi:NACHT domain-containing protein [Peribacillus simplex]|uniref:NACHT domain-containing protein n=1 Tax=Peribacillus simplex TaxID=1478 RepID=UPI002E209A53|nr:NACHT domain-containing protein [Peribacillus simplex]